MTTPLPSWAPACPWPREEFPAMREELEEAVPNAGTRALIIASLMHDGWRAAEEAIYDRLEKALHNAAIKLPK